jgi:flagellar hook-associated protein 3 FlgL
MTGTIQIFDKAISNFKSIQSDLVDVQSKIGAESKASTFAELGEDINTVQNFEESLQRTQRFMSTIQGVQRKLDTTYQSVSQIIDVAISVKENITVENSANREVNDLGGKVDSAFDQISGALNTKFGSTYLFSGAKTNQPAINVDLRNVSNIVDGEITANYYNGDGFTASADVSASVRVNYGVNASNEAFQNLIGALNLAKQAEDSETDLTPAGEALDNAIEQLIELRSRMGDNSKVLDQTLSFHEAAEGIISEKLSNAKSPDIIELSIDSANLQAQLQASFSIFSRISSLRLTDYI